MTLDNADINKGYRLVSCDVPPKTRSKLETLGLVPGEHINVIQRTNAGLIIEVKRSRLAIAHDLAESFVVHELWEE